MNDRDLPTTSAAHIDAISRAMSGDSFARAPEEAIHVRNFAFGGIRLPGWTFARPREVDTGSGVRLIQVNARADGSDGMARIEVLEAADRDQGRAAFVDTLTRFQRDPASVLRTPPSVGEAEAYVDGGTVVFLRGNLVVTITTIGKTALHVEDLARQLDRSICGKPHTEGDARGSAPASSGLMVKAFTRTGAAGRQKIESYEIDAAGMARRLPEDGD